MSDQQVHENIAEGNNSLDPAQAVRDRIKQQLADAQKARSLTHKSPVTIPDLAAISIHRRALQRMQEFLLSGEPILLVEVGQWLAKQSQAVRNELIDAEDDVTKGLLCDLAEIALRLVQRQLSPWAVRFQLEERFGKSLILELTPEERQGWVRSLST